MRTLLAAPALVALTACGLVEAPDLVDTISRDTTTETGSPTSTDAPVDDTAAAADPLGAADAHNAVRAAAQPTPIPPLPDLTWDAGLADVARTWAERCVWAHSGNGYGENLYFSTWESTIEEAVQSWASEAASYNYGANTCSADCGHYTQIVWRTTARVGCGHADCASISGIPYAGRIWVCTYDPPGNFNGTRPY